MVIYYALFSTSLARKRGNNLSHNFHANVQTHRQPLWHCGTFPTSRRRDNMAWRLLAHAFTFGEAHACVWTYAKPVCVLFVTFQA